MYPGLIACYYVPNKQIPVTVWVSNSHLMLFVDKPSFLVKHLRDPSHTDFCHLQVFCKIILTELVLIPTVSTVCCILTRRFCKTLFSTAWQFSSWTANDGHPDGGSTSSLVLPPQNSAVHHLTMAYDSTSSPQTKTFTCVSPAAERSLLASKILLLCDSGFC